jgi:hypothetical protein
MNKGGMISFFLMIFLVDVCFAQAPDTAWTRAYGGSNGEGAYAIDRTSDGCFIVTGEMEPAFANKNVYLLKIDSNGDTLWTRDFGGANTDEIGRSVRQTSDGGFIIGGYGGVGESNDVILIKTDSLGNYEWDTAFGPTPDNRGHCVRQTSDGGYIIAGQAYVVRGAFGSYDAYVIKTDSQGGLQWQRIVGGDAPDFALGVCETSDGGFIATGRTSSSGGWEAYLFKLSANGDSVWADGVGNGAQDEGTGIMALADGSGVIFTGVTVSINPGDSDAFLSRADNNGNVIWTRTYGDGEEEYGQSVVATPDGGYVLGGMRATFQTGWNVYVIKTDSLGNQQWTDEFGEDGDDRGHGVACGSDGSIVVAGWTTSFGGGWLDVYLVKFVGSPVGIDDNIALPQSAMLMQNFPNPFNANTVISYFMPQDSHVKMEVFDLTGRRVELLVDERQAAGEHKIVWNPINLSSGIYFYRIHTADFIENKAMMLMK